eukprot:scaffold462403_cov17-Prasinocladus_malaysianus.AAC.1
MEGRAGSHATETVLAGNEVRPAATSLSVFRHSPQEDSLSLRGLLRLTSGKCMSCVLGIGNRTELQACRLDDERSSKNFGQEELKGNIYPFAKW